MAKPEWLVFKPTSEALRHHTAIYLRWRSSKAVAAAASRWRTVEVYERRMTEHLVKITQLTAHRLVAAGKIPASKAYRVKVRYQSHPIWGDQWQWALTPHYTIPEMPKSL